MRHHGIFGFDGRFVFAVKVQCLFSDGQCFFRRVRRFLYFRRVAPNEHITGMRCASRSARMFMCTWVVSLRESARCLVHDNVGKGRKQVSHSRQILKGV